MSRPRMAVGSMLAALLLLMSVAGNATAATGTQANVLQNVCTESGGANGRGYLLLKVKVREVGQSGVNQFRIKSSLQGNSGAGWGTQTTYPPELSSHFADDSVTHYRIVTRRYDFTRGDEVSFRLQMKVQFLSDRNGVLTTKTVNGCTG